jgi:hypothetical protein
MLVFDNRALRQLPIDPNSENRTRQVFGSCFSRVTPTPVRAPRTLTVAAEVAELLGFSQDFVASQEFAGSSPAIDSCRAWSRPPLATADTNSAIGRGSSGTGEPSRWASW